MLFEQVKLTAAKCQAIISRAFLRAARKQSTSSSNSVPIPVLEAYGRLDHRIRYLCDARVAQGKLRREQARHIRKLEKQLDKLPSQIIESLRTPASENWLEIYRLLIQLHESMLHAKLCVGADEYEELVQQFIGLAQVISDHSLVAINTSSIFALLLMQVHIQQESATPQRQRKPDRRPRRRKKAESVEKVQQQ